MKKFSILACVTVVWHALLIR